MVHMHPTIIEAINKHRVLNVFYVGYNRSAEPHAYGINSACDEAVSCYQVGGGSASGNPEGWKMLWISKLNNAALTEQLFIPRTPPFLWAEKPMKRVPTQM